MNIKIDASRVAGLITGSANLDKVVYDTWYLKDVELMSGKIYGLVSEYGQGCMYLSYLLGGKIDFGDLQIFIDGINVSKEDLKSISWNLEPSKEKYKNKTVRKSIEKSIIKNKCSDTFEDIVERLELIERTTEYGNLSDIPSALHSFYKKYSFAKMPFGSIFTVEETRKMSYQQPFMDEEWFCFGQDNYGFVFWLCKEVDKKSSQCQAKNRFEELIGSDPCAYIALGGFAH